MKDNYVKINDIVTILKDVKQITGLEVKKYILQCEIGDLPKTKQNLQYPQNNQSI